MDSVRKYYYATINTTIIVKIKGEDLELTKSNTHFNKPDVFLWQPRKKKEQEFINEFYSYKFVCYKMIMAS